MASERFNGSMSDDHLRLIMADSVRSALEQYDDRIMDHMRSTLIEIRAEIASGFPGGDLHGHKVAHEKMMERARDCKTFKERLVAHITTYGVMAAIGWLLLMTWDGVRAWLRGLL